MRRQLVLVAVALFLSACSSTPMEHYLECRTPEDKDRVMQYVVECDKSNRASTCVKQAMEMFCDLKFVPKGQAPPKPSDPFVDDIEEALDAPVPEPPPEPDPLGFFDRKK